MSFEALRWACELELPAHEKVVLVQLAHHHNRDTGQCNPSLERLAKYTGLSRSAVCRAMKKLSVKKLLDRNQRFNNGAQLSTSYSLLMGYAPSEAGHQPPCPIDTPPVAISYPPVPIGHGGGVRQTLPPCPIDTQTRNKNKEVNKRDQRPADGEAKTSQSPRLDFSGTELPSWLSRENWIAYLDVRKVKKSPFSSERAVTLWMEKMQKDYDAGLDTANMVEQMIASNWIGPVREKFVQRKVEWVDVTNDPEKAWPELYGKGKVIQ